MTRDGTSKKQRQADQRRRKRMQAAYVWLSANKVPWSQALSAVCGPKEIGRASCRERV